MLYLTNVQIGDLTFFVYSSLQKTKHVQFHSSEICIFFTILRLTKYYFQIELQHASSSIQFLSCSALDISGLVMGNGNGGRHRRQSSRDLRVYDMHDSTWYPLVQLRVPGRPGMQRRTMMRWRGASGASIYRRIGDILECKTRHEKSYLYPKLRHTYLPNTSGKWVFGPAPKCHLSWFGSPIGTNDRHWSRFVPFGGRSRFISGNRSRFVA
jgi:hypothetical protein